MKRFSLLAASFVVATSLAAPLLASATVGAGQTCVLGTECNSGVCSGGVCIGGGTTNITPPGTSGSVNQQWTQYYRDLIVWAINQVLVPVLFAVAFIVFLWGVYNYFIYGADDETKRKDGRQFVLWGIIGFVIISSVWAFVNIVKDTVIPAGQSNRPDYPKL